MEKFKKFLAHVFKILKWAFLVLVGAFIILVIVRIPHAVNQQKTDAQIIKIHNTKLTLPDVMGENLPPNPGLEADKTVQGIDANNNGIRDDVELAIFKEYPNSAKTRAVLLQYALTLQMMANQPFINTSIATSVMQEKSRAYICVGESLVRDDNNPEVMQKYFENSEKLRTFIDSKQLNTPERIKNDQDFYEKVRSYSDVEGICDLNLSILPN